jgi:transcription initiation factor TFIIB
LYVANRTTDDTDDISWLSYCKIRNSTEEQLATAFEAIENISVDLAVQSSIRREAATLFCDAFCSGITVGRGTDCIAAVCLSITAQQAAQPIPRGRLLDAMSVAQKGFNLAYRALCCGLEIKVEPAQPVQYLPFFASDLRLLADQVTDATNLLEAVAGRTEFVGKSSVGVTSAAVYLASEKSTQREVADSGGISSETVRQRADDFRRLCALD